MKLKRIIASFLMAISILFVTTAAADEIKHKLTLELVDGSVLEKDNVDYLEILLQNGENVSVIYLEKANDWKVETELIPGTYKIIIRNISPSKYLISNDYSATISDKDVTSKISIKEFPSEEVNKKPQEVEKEPIKEENKEQQHQTTSQTLKTRSIKIAMTVILCTLAAAVILIILWFVSKIIR